MRGVEAVYGGPALGAVADVAGDALVAGDADQGCHEAIVSFTVIGRSQSHNRRANAAGREGECVFCSRPPSARATSCRSHRRVGAMPIPLGRHTPQYKPKQPGGDDQRSVRTSQHLAEGLDGAALGVGGRLV